MTEQPKTPDDADRAASDIDPSSSPQPDIDLASPSQPPGALASPPTSQHDHTQVLLRSTPNLQTIDTTSPSPSSLPQSSTVEPDSDMIISPAPPLQMHTQARAQEIGVGAPDPRIASLKAMFPDFDDAVILSVLESTDNDQDRALDALLVMNDPSYVPPVPPPPPSQPQHEYQRGQPPDSQRLSQEALDEQFARRLALEEEQAALQSWGPQSAGDQSHQSHRGTSGWGGGWSGWSGQPQGQGQQGQGQGGQGQQGQPGGQGGRDTVTEFQDGFNRIAESGKKTFTSIVSKVKAKMQEYDQGQGQGRGQGQGQPQYQGQGSYNPSYAPGQTAYPQPYQGAPAGQVQRQTTQSYPVRTSSPSWSNGQPRTNTYAFAPPPRPSAPSAPTPDPPQPESAQRSYYDPNARGYDLNHSDDDNEDPFVDVPNPAVPPSPSTAIAPPTLPSYTPFNANANTASTTTTTTDPPNQWTSTAPPPARTLSPTTAGSSVYVTPAPGAASTALRSAPTAANPISVRKLGLLPKRPISLARAQSPPVSGVVVHSSGGNGGSVLPVGRTPSGSTTGDEEDELEYTENPFEGRR
ncbi:hypothetical protein PAXINDRAFT_18872 [Paxillus involutus ATCC 200175]|uniref:CUE domain-containing protein n=1 Tax=Paxillus involutus ATCC 200175 TaxID=664439 RepID=A0A0C9TA35_PAXIN|nr:hypothetical protein PAXINDRAFT_18872 [Paxillus involutus ATCC 200175]